MKRKFNSLFDVLEFTLQGVNATEAMLINDVGLITDQLTSAATRYEVDSYLGTLRDNQIGIERVFTYLMKNDLTRTNAVMREMIHETHGLLSQTNQASLKEILMITSLQNIVAYKISMYRAAYQIALELELETPADILQQLLEKEMNAAKSFDRISLIQFTNVP